LHCNLRAQVKVDVATVAFHDRVLNKPPRQVGCRSIHMEICMRSMALALLLVAAATAPALAASCSTWKATCEKRGGGSYCEAQFSKCLATGTWVEGSKFGGGTHSGLTKN
jgi:hypothetical protein